MLLVHQLKQNDQYLKIDLPVALLSAHLLIRFQMVATRSLLTNQANLILAVFANPQNDKARLRQIWSIRTCQLLAEENKQKAYPSESVLKMASPLTRAS